MQEQDELIHQRIRTIVMELMAVLHDNGITQVNVGAMMRLLGVDSVKAQAHDNDVIEIDEKFGLMLDNLNKQQSTVPVTVPKGTVFH